VFYLVVGAMYEHMNIYTYKYIHIQTYIYVSVEKNNKVFCWVVGAMGWLRSVPSIKLQVSLAEYCLFYRALLQKRPIILWILLTKATPYVWTYECLYTHKYIYIQTYICVSLEKKSGVLMGSRCCIWTYEYLYKYVNTYIYRHIYVSH